MNLPSDNLKRARTLWMWILVYQLKMAQSYWEVVWHLIPRSFTYLPNLTYWSLNSLSLTMGIVIVNFLCWYRINTGYLAMHGIETCIWHIINIISRKVETYGWGCIFKEKLTCRQRNTGMHELAYWQRYLTSFSLLVTRNSFQFKCVLPLKNLHFWIMLLLYWLMYVLTHHQNSCHKTNFSYYQSPNICTERGYTGMLLIFIMEGDRWS